MSGLPTIRPRPEMPRPFIPDSPAAIAWHADFQAWVTEKERAEVAARVAGLVVPNIDLNRPTCTPRADYQWRDIPARRSNAVAGPRKCHDCSERVEGQAIRCKRCANKHAHRNRAARYGDKEYYRMKARESRERRRQAAREAMDERTTPPSPHLLRVS